MGTHHHFEMTSSTKTKRQKTTFQTLLIFARTLSPWKSPSIDWPTRTTWSQTAPGLTPYLQFPENTVTWSPSHQKQWVILLCKVHEKFYFYNIAKHKKIYVQILLFFAIVSTTFSCHKQLIYLFRFIVVKTDRRRIQWYDRSVRNSGLSLPVWVWWRSHSGTCLSLTIVDI